MPESKHKPTTLSLEGSTSESLSPLVSEQEEFRRQLRRQVMREELDESHWGLVGRMYTHAPCSTAGARHWQEGR